jgi:hypothetical protein
MTERAPKTPRKAIATATAELSAAADCLAHAATAFDAFPDLSTCRARILALETQVGRLLNELRLEYNKGAL